MQDQKARVVIIGSGIAGASIAYHLTALRWHDIVVLATSPLHSRHYIARPWSGWTTAAHP